MLNSIEKFKSSILHLNRDWNHWIVHPKHLYPYKTPTITGTKPLLEQKKGVLLLLVIVSVVPKVAKMWSWPYCNGHILLTHRAKHAEFMWIPRVSYSKLAEISRSSRGLSGGKWLSPLRSRLGYTAYHDSIVLDIQQTVTCFTTRWGHKYRLIIYQSDSLPKVNL